MASKSSHLEEHAAKQKEPGVSWKQNEEHVIPKNRLSIVSFALVCTMFIAALDLVSRRVSCCRIGLMVGWGGISRRSSQLHCPPSWPIFTGAVTIAGLGGMSSFLSSIQKMDILGSDARCVSAYMLTAGAFGSLYGKLSNMFGGVLRFRCMQTTSLTYALGRKPLLYLCIATFLVCFGFYLEYSFTYFRHVSLDQHFAGLHKT